MLLRRSSTFAAESSTAANYLISLATLATSASATTHAPHFACAFALTGARHYRTGSTQSSVVSALATGPSRWSVGED